MKRLSLLLGTLIVFSSAPVRSAVIISSLTTSPSLTNPQTGDAILQTLTAGATTYTSLTAANSVTGISGTAEYLWGTTGTNPGSVATALTDLNLTTGSLNTGVNALYGFNSISASTMFFFLGNYGADNPVSVSLVDATGTTIATALTLTTTSASNDLATLTENRSGSAGTLSRTIRGYVFGVNEFTFTGGNTVANAAGFKINGTGFDTQEVGIAAIPEPGTLGLLSLGALAFATGRRRR